MAENTLARNNALGPTPIYGLPYTVSFPMLDADGDTVTGATTPDAEISKNGDTFADCTNESTEVSTASGNYYLNLTGTELTADIAMIQAKSATSGMKTTVLVLYPVKLPIIRSGTGASAGSSTSTIVLDSGASAIDDYYNGCVVSSNNDGTVEVRTITDYVGSTKTASVVPDWNVAPDNNDAFEIRSTAVWVGRLADVIANAGSAITSAAGIQEVKVASIANNAITAASINADAITDAKVASDVTIASVTGAVGSVTGNVGGNVTGSVGSVATGGITTASFASGAINAAAIATDAIGALELAAGAASEIATAVRTELGTELGRIDVATSTRASQTSVDTIDGIVDDILVDTGTTLQAEMDGIQADTEDIQTRLPAALVGGRIDATLDATGLEAGALALINAEVDTAISDAALATAANLATVDTVVDAIKLATDKLDDTLEDQGGGVYGFTVEALQEAPTGGSAPTAAAIADAVWEEALADHEGTAGSTAEALASAGGSGASAADIADAVLDEAMAGHTTAGTLGKAVADILVDTAEIGAAGAGLTNINLPNQTMDIVGNITGNLSGSVGSLGAQAKLDVNAEADTALADYDGPTNAELATALGTADDAVLAAIAALNNLSAAQVAAALNTYDAPTKAEFDAAVVLLATAANLALVDTVVDGIKAKTDSLTFTEAGKVDAHLRSINNTPVEGSGVLGDKWRPAP